MTNRNYVNGRAFEYRVAERLRELGYAVIRSAGSKGPADLVGVKPGDIVFIQAKRNGACGPAERIAFFTAASGAGALAVIAYMPGSRGIAFDTLHGPDGIRAKGGFPR